MHKLAVLVEGVTEQTFVRDLLAGHLALRKTTAWPILSGKQQNRGGVKGWAATRQDIIRVLKQGQHCSTMFDYYALPNDWPGRGIAAAQPWAERAGFVERMIHADVAEAVGDGINCERMFILYIQLHEFEALAFADIAALTSVLAPIGQWSASYLSERLEAILTHAGHPEAINDGYETCPSRQIVRLVPAYKKPAHGAIVTGRIGLDTLRQRCNHFAAWLARLEALGVVN